MPIVPKAMSCCISCLLLFIMRVSFSSAAEVTVTYSDAPIWTVGIGVQYLDLEITLGETLSFVSHVGHDVVLMHHPSSGSPFDQCSMSGIPAENMTSVWASSDFDMKTDKHYTPPTCGDFYIACSISAHCAYGQKIKVTVKNSDASPCASPCSGSSCVTADSKLFKTAGTIHGVKPAADSRYWGTGPYDDLTVNVGDTILFRTGAGFHDIATVPTLAEYNSCDVSKKTVLADWAYPGPFTSQLCNETSACCAGSSCGASGYFVTYKWTAQVPGEVYVVCSLGNHCQTGQKFRVTVREAPATEITVTYSDEPIWTVGIGVQYPDLEITLGETLSFVSHVGHDVVLMHHPSSGSPFDQCGMAGIPAENMTSVWASSDFGMKTDKHYTPPTCGDFYIACSISAHCAYGQKVKVTVKNADASPCASPCSGSSCVTPDSKLFKTAGTVHGVKPAPDSGYWGTGPYDALTVNVGDTILFRTGAGFHDIATVSTLAEFNSCDVSKKTVLADWAYPGPFLSQLCNETSACCAGSSCGSSGYFVTYKWTAEVPGDVFFVCSLGNHCQTGQKFQVTVRGDVSATSAAPSLQTSSTATVSDEQAASPASSVSSSDRVLVQKLLVGMVLIVSVSVVGM